MNNTGKVITKIRLLTESSTVRCISVSMPAYWLESCISISCFPFLAEIFAVNTELIFQFAETTNSSMPGSVEGEYHVHSQRKPVSLLRAGCTKPTLTSSPHCSPPCDGYYWPWLPSLSQVFSISKLSEAFLFSDLPTLKKILLILVARGKWIKLMLSPAAWLGFLGYLITIYYYYLLFMMMMMLLVISSPCS